MAIGAAFCPDVDTLWRKYLLQFFNFHYIIVRSQCLLLNGGRQNNSCTYSVSTSIQPIHSNVLQ